MRILWHSVAPWIPTGYGTQTDLWTRYLAAAGHTVAISPYFGNQGRETEWHGVTVLPGPIEGDGLRLMSRHVREFKPDVIVLLCDMWALSHARLPRDVPILAWTPVDCTPLGMGEEIMFRQPGWENMRAVAMSSHGLRQLLNAGIEPAGYVPHALNMGVWRPDPEREIYREAMGITGRFAVGMVFNNVDPTRKATPQQIAGFAGFWKKHPDSVLFVHTMAKMPGSIDVNTVVDRIGLADTGAVRISDQQKMRDGTFTTEDMVHFYSAMDVVLNATCGEGFGLPSIEAQACGTPVILADNSTGTQLRTPNVGLVSTVPIWNPTHNAWWGMPRPASVTGQLELVRARPSAKLREAARRNAMDYDIAQVGPLWLDILDTAVK